jgi:hypothetical protein
MRSPKPLTSMTMDEALAWGERIRAAQGLNSSPKGAFQIVNTTQRAAMRALGIRGDEMFSPENQRRMASWIARKQGLGAWEGFKLHPGERSRAANALSAGEDKKYWSHPAGGGSTGAAAAGAPGGATAPHIDASSARSYLDTLQKIEALQSKVFSDHRGHSRRLDSFGKTMRTQFATGGIQGD